MTARTGSDPAADARRGATKSPTTGDRAHPGEPAAAPLGTDDEAGGARPTTPPTREAAVDIRTRRSTPAPSGRWRQVGAAVLLLALIVAVFAVPVFIR